MPSEKHLGVSSFSVWRDEITNCKIKSNRLINSWRFSMRNIHSVNIHWNGMNDFFQNKCEDWISNRSDLFVFLSFGNKHIMNACN